MLLFGTVPLPPSTRRGHAVRSSTPILGPALDGSGEFAAIEATRDSARWHGNRTWDRAVGPMQFIPSTWRTWQADGDGDGSAAPNDLDDAALAAAPYLYQSGDLMVGDTWARAILRYNNSTDTCSTSTPQRTGTTTARADSAPPAKRPVGT